MDFSLLFNNTILNKTVNEILSDYDQEKDGRYSRDEFSIFIKEAKSPLGRVSSIFYSDRRLIKDAYKMFDDNDDGYITQNEFDKFLEKEYNLNLDSLRDKKAKEVCDIITLENQKKKKKKLKNND